MGTMGEVIESVIAYLRSNVLLSLVIALITGGAACRSLASDRLSGPVVYCLIGIAGLFVSQLVIVHLELLPYLEQIGDFRILVDFGGAYVVSLFIAALISAINPD